MRLGEVRNNNDNWPNRHSERVVVGIRDYEYVTGYQKFKMDRPKIKKKVLIPNLPRAGPVISSILIASACIPRCARSAELARSGIKPISRKAAVVASVYAKDRDVVDRDVSVSMIFEVKETSGEGETAKCRC